MIPAQCWVFSRPEGSSRWLAAKRALLQGFSHPLPCCVFPLILVLLHVPQCFQNYFLTERKKQTPDNVYLHFGPKWLQSPAHGCLCPLYPPQHGQGNCGEGLVVSCVDLVPVSAWETHSTAWAESVCHRVGFDSFTHFVASDVFSYRKTDM